MSEIKKPVITKEQARAIEEGLKCYVRQGLDLGPKLYNRFLIDHANVLTEVDDPWAGMFSCLNDLDLMTLAAALINGYEVEKTPEESVREFYDSFECGPRMYPAEMSFRNEEYRRIIKCTLNRLGIKIEGVNA
ncbi:hypothetical protein LQ247_20050 [Bacillus sp. BS3(2021)]|uniref:hypothetical protein n=1 Tax=Bacillus TaxID=1386 RepID=UPI001E4409EA|nr:MULTISPECIES: hypothetical protein [Bacillus]MCD2370908.1 hypothetical protein [Bacillus sp. BS3(2021)]MCJ8232301.1 hypothetical protein [Bacillus paralicheniformis]